MKKILVNYNEFLALANAPQSQKHKAFQTGGRSLEVTEKQKRTMHKFDIGYTGMRFRGEACDVIELLIRRCEEKLATPLQMVALRKRGVENVHLISFAEASRILGTKPIIKQNIQPKTEQKKIEEQEGDFVVIFKFDNGKKLTACSRIEARNYHHWLRRDYGKYEFMII